MNESEIVSGTGNETETEIETEIANETEERETEETETEEIEPTTTENSTGADGSVLKKMKMKTIQDAVCSLMSVCQYFAFVR